VTAGMRYRDPLATPFNSQNTYFLFFFGNFKLFV